MRGERSMVCSSGKSHALSFSAIDPGRERFNLIPVVKFPFDLECEIREIADGVDDLPEVRVDQRDISSESLNLRSAQGAIVDEDLVDDSFEEVAPFAARSPDL